MKRYLTLINLLFLCVLTGTVYAKKHHAAHSSRHISARHSSKSRKHHHHEEASLVLPESSIANLYPGSDIVSPDSVMQFAQTLLGTPYREASSNPLYGFDCSGFVSYVFKNFNFNVPRSSSEFYNAGERIDITDAKPGDVILFTGTKSHHPHSIGHMGIICSNDSTGIKFIHSTSGKEYCVTITDFNDTYKRRFVQVIRLLKQNDEPQEVAQDAVSAAISQ
jgi:murein DD-endopeptidase / murein LD-carboxypeptidase